MLHRWQQLIHLLFPLQSMEVYMNLLDDEKLEKYKAKQALVRQLSWQQNGIFFLLNCSLQIVDVWSSGAENQNHFKKIRMIKG